MTIDAKSLLQYNPTSGSPSSFFNSFTFSLFAASKAFKLPALLLACVEGKRTYDVVLLITAMAHDSKKGKLCKLPFLRYG